MSTQEIQLEIQKIMANLPDESLMAVLDYLKTIQKTSPSEVLLSKNLNDILEEDSQLLKRLAE